MKMQIHGGGCAIALVLVAAATAAERHVPAEYPTIQSAINAAKAGDVVIVADGEYSGTGNHDISFLGKAITVRSANGAATCTIDCKASPEHPARGIQFVSGKGPDSVLEGFTITGGATPPGAIADQFNGGGILCNGSAPTIKDCVIRDNSFGCWGGGICCTDASPTIIGSTIAGNASGFAGGVYGFGGTITNTIVWGNEGEQLWGSSEVTYSNIQGGGFEGHGNVDVDPRFVDLASGDFRLQPGSPMIDIGNSGAVPAGVEFDFEGDPRIISGRVDIGADEMHRTGDVDFDGSVGVSDLVAVVLAWGPWDGCAEDVTGDGFVNVGDLIEVILNFD